MAALVIVGKILVLIGSIFLFLGALGIFRMPDIYNRLQAGTKATTLGAMSIILGVGLIKLTLIWKAIIMIVFIAMTAPISSHLIARVAYKEGINLTEKTVVDKCKEFCKEEGGN
jgi:multicomponent Na+:H+ antiporter subunit G